MGGADPPRPLGYGAQDASPVAVQEVSPVASPVATAGVNLLFVQTSVRISMAAAGNPYENAKAKRFFKTLKCEEVYLQQYRTFAEAEANLGRFIDDVFNARRLHSSLGYLPPAEFEANHEQRSGWSKEGGTPC